MKRLNRILALLMVVVMMTSVLCTTAFAQENYTATDSYALNYNGVYSGAKWQYFSPYYPAYTYNGTSTYTESIIFSLYNTVTKTCIPAYCTDIDTGLDSNSDFRRINLEDSTYAAAGAGVLRSILLKGFPNVDTATLGAAAGVENLTVGEAVAATQAAIWQTAHGALLDFNDFCYMIDCAWSSAQNQYYDLCVAEYKTYGFADGDFYSDPSVTGYEDLIESHIEAVFDYLINLPATAPTGVAVSNASFVSWDNAPTVTTNEDGTCDVTVTATVNVQMTSADSLTLSAVIGGYYASSSLTNGSNTVTLTIKNVPADVAGGDVTLAIDGTQTVSDVFLFDAEGERGTSQSLIGIDNSQLPVHAEVTVETERVINFVKTTKEATGNDTYNYVPLSGIIFDIYYIGSLAKYESGSLSLNYAIPYGQPDYTVVTDKNGRASFSLTRNNMEDGVYLIVEREHPAIVKPVDPFYVVMPMTSADGSSWVYEVTVQPKNEVQGGVDIEKDVISLGNNNASLDAYTPHTWIISASIPTDIADGKEYIISDTLDNRLDYVGNMVVTVETDSTATDETIGETVTTSEVKLTLNESTDYTLTVTNNDSLVEGTPSDSFTVALTAAGMDKVAAYAGSGVIRVYFDAQINANAEMGSDIPNQATLDYTNSVNYNFDAKSDKPVVCTGGAKLIKVDAIDGETTLAGAVFEVYRPATVDEIADEEVETVKIDGMDAQMVKVSFYATADLSGEKVTSVTSDANGNVVIYGLAFGTYYLVETQAPSGYNKLGTPIELTIGNSSHFNDNVIKVLNNAGTTLPETGGIGTTIFYALGGVLVLAAIVLLVTKKRMNREG